VTVLAAILPDCNVSSLHVYSQKTAQDLQNRLDDITELPESDSFPLFHLLPEVLQHHKQLMLLPPELKNFMLDSKTAETRLKESKDITVAAYVNARKLLGGARAVVCIPPKELLQVHDPPCVGFVEILLTLAFGFARRLEQHVCS